MIVTPTWIEANYNKFNKMYWDGKLPAIKFKVNRSRQTWGFASYKFDYANDTIIPECITLSNYYDSPEEVKFQTLLHEMIHIADYTFYPHRFFHNGHKVSARVYNAHGSWFQAEAARISKASGLLITNHVTREEIGKSTFSEKTKRCIEHKQNSAILCVVKGTHCNFYFKTDIYKVKTLNKTIHSYSFYRIGEIKSIKYYTFNDEQLANIRSCGVRLRGWFASNTEMATKLKEIKATEVKF